MLKKSKIEKDGRSFYFFEISDKSESLWDKNVVVSFITDDLDMEEKESVVNMAFYIKPAEEKYDVLNSFNISYQKLKDKPIKIKLSTLTCLYFYSISQYSNYLLLHITQKFIRLCLAKKINSCAVSKTKVVFSEKTSKALNICDTYSEILLDILKDKMDEDEIIGGFGGKICLS